MSLHLCCPSKRKKKEKEFGGSATKGTLQTVMMGTVKHDKKIHVWGWMRLCYRGWVMVLDYRHYGPRGKYLNILEEPMVQSADLLLGGENWHFRQDNDPKHTAKRVKEWLSDYNCIVMHWPSPSPDLNPIENLWSLLDRTLCNRKCKSAAELFQALTVAWQNLAVDFLEKLVGSMPQRCQAVIDNRGFPTKYLICSFSII
jgi:hypothetical protein